VNSIERLVQAAEAVWATDVRDVKGSGVNVFITEIFDACGWGKWLRGPHGGCPDGYTRPPDPDWCGLFVGYCGLHAGLKHDVARLVLPSTYRLFAKSFWEKAEVPKPQEGLRTPQRGDIVVVGTNPHYGAHITLCVDVEESLGVYYTIEGNGRGTFPDGSKGVGVIKRTRKIAEINRIYRLTEEHFEWNS
jgi:hypothetical protein